MTVNYYLHIAKKKYFRDWQSLSLNPKIKYVLEMPYDYLLFDYYDEIFEIQYSQDKNVRDLTCSNPQLGERAILVDKEQKEILQPLYSHPKARDIYGYRSCIALSISTKVKNYFVNEPGNPQSIDLSAWEISFSTNKIKMLAVLKSQKDSNLKSFEKTIENWYEWAMQHDVLDCMSETSYEGNSLELEIIFKDRNFIDFLAALATMGYETHRKTSLMSITFSDLEGV